MARIYVIDDDEQLLRMVGLMLERGGHTTVLINDPVQGLEQVKNDRPDLLVLDVMMPDMSGHDLTRQIRSIKELEDLPILILTARSQEIDRATALKSGANGYLSKPVTSQELIERVDSLLTKKAEKPAPEQGIIIALYGFRGGAGQTTLAVNLAAALRRLSQQEVCLADLTTSGGQIMLHLRLQTRSSWADLLYEEEITWSVLKNRLMIHPSGLRLLAAPPLPQEPDTPNAVTTTKILGVLRENSLFTVVDLPPVFSPCFKAALAMADMALHVVAPEVVSVQTAVQLNRLLTKSGVAAKYKSHILNQTSAEAQIPAASVERALNTRIAFQVGFDPNQARAMAQGVPLSLTAAKSPLPVVVNRMAEVIWQRVTKKEAT